MMCIESHKNIEDYDEALLGKFQIGHLSMDGESLFKLLKTPIRPFSLDRGRRIIDILPFSEQMDDRSNILRRHHKSICVFCDVMEYSFNSNRKTVCGNCLDVIMVRDALSVLVNTKRRSIFKRTVLMMRDNIEMSRSKQEFEDDEEWAVTVNGFFRRMPWNLKNRMVDFLF